MKLKVKNIKSKVKTFGCRLNTLESQLIQNNIDNSQNENILVVNTCAVTGEAEKQAQQFIRKSSRENPSARIIVTGCAAQINPEKWSSMREVSAVIGNSEKLQKSTWDKDFSNTHQVSDIMQVTQAEPLLSSGIYGRKRAFVQIQQGCDHRCTFCIIPYGRGNSRSVSIGNIVKNAENLVNLGHKEIVLTGVDITSWGKDLKNRPSLGYLVKSILSALPDLSRLRLSSIDPAEVDVELMDALANEKRLMPHLHLSIQHGDNLILKRMKRRHLNHDIRKLVEEARSCRPDLVLGADFISGFPTENISAHQNNLDIIKELEICWGHIFPYSPREGTPAAKMPQVKLELRKVRARELRKLCEKNAIKWMDQQIGSYSRVLMEGTLNGHCEYFSNVRLYDEVEPGTIQKIKITKRDGLILRGKPMKDEGSLH